MGMITSATRMWLTKSVKGFEFKNEYSNTLEYQDTKQLGLYVHIPFCRTICKFCPYCKEVYHTEKMNRYIDYLLKEIALVTGGQAKKVVSSLYFGGGTPALAIDRLGEVIDSLTSHFEISQGIGIELHPSNVTEKLLQKLSDIGVTKISIGIQSFQDKFLGILGRKENRFETMFDALQKVSFETVAMDFIFALPNQTFQDLQKDIELAFSNGANHIAIYPFIDFGFLESGIQEFQKKEKRALLKQITDYCEERGYTRDSIWTFSKDGRASYSSMTRDNFLGFGASATTCLDEIFKINTFSVEEYINRLQSEQLPTSLTLDFTVRQRMIYYLFWKFYSMKVDCKEFQDFFNQDLKKIYGLELFFAKRIGFLTERDGVYELTEKGAFYYHHYEKYFTYDYINHMWGTMSKEAFPKQLNIK